MMLLCLSSGYSRRYRQDILRSVGLPIGSELQFRYRTKWVTEGVQRKIKEGKLRGEDVLIAYADQSSPGQDDQPVELVPVRKATVTTASRPGSTISLTFKLGPIVRSGQLTSFNNEVQNLSGQAIPRWASGKATGSYCVEIPSLPTHIIEADRLNEWEQLIDELAGRSDFAAEPTFVTVLGFPEEKQFLQRSPDYTHLPWPTRIQPGRDRRLVLYHYRPESSAGKQSEVEIKIRTGRGLELRSIERARIDSPYDVKTFRIASASRISRGWTSWIEVQQVADDNVLLGFETQVNVAGAVLKSLGLSAFIALALTGSQVWPILEANFSDAITGASIGIATVANLMVGLAAVFGLRRGI